MITDAEWDEMREAARMRLRFLRDEIKDYKAGNRAYILEGVADAASSEQNSLPAAPAEPTDDERLKSIGVSKILEGIGSKAVDV